jgi:hypothetical protein
MQQWGNNQIQRNAGIPAFISPVLLVPKAAISMYYQQMPIIFLTKAGLLTYSIFSRPSHPCEGSGKQVAKDYFAELTASGNVLEFHRVPFSSRKVREPLQGQKYKVIGERGNIFFDMQGGMGADVALVGLLASKFIEQGVQCFSFSFIKSH